MQARPRLFVLAFAVTALSLGFSAASPPAAAQPTPAPPAGNPAGAAGTTAGTAAPLIGPPTPGGLTAEEVAQRASVTSHDVRARAEEAAAADAALDQARAGYIPRLSGLARYTRLSSIDQPTLGTLVAAPPGTPREVPAGTPLFAVPLSFPVILDQYTTQATLQVPLSDYLLRLPALGAAAEKNARAARLLQQAARLRVATEARIAYYTWARTRLYTEVARRAVAQARAHLVDVEAAHTSGASSKADVLRVAAQVAAAELGLARTSAAAAIAERRLRTLMHDDSGRRFEIGEDLRGVPAGAREAKTLPGEKVLLDRALERRFEARALGEAAAGAREQARAARAAGLPRVDAVANALWARPNGRIFPQQDEFRGTWDATIQLSFAPTDLFGSEAGHSALRARARQLSAERDALSDGIRLEIASSAEALAESETAIATSRRGLEAAEESYRVRRALYQNGRATSVELTDAETELSRAQLEAIGAQIDRRVAEARLAHAVGDDVRE